jgi:hypothetical protein
LATETVNEQVLAGAAGVGIGGAPPNVPTDALLEPIQTSEQLVDKETSVPMDEDRDVAIRWVDATDSLFDSGEPEEDRRDCGEYFAVSLSGDAGKEMPECSMDLMYDGQSEPPAHATQHQPPSGSEEQEFEIPDKEPGVQLPTNQNLVSTAEEDRVGFTSGGADAGVADIAQNLPQETEGGDLACIKAFCASIIKTLAPPLLREVESMSRLRADAEPFTPRRVTRRATSASVSAVGKQAKKASTAETVLLKALGITPADLSASEEDLAALQQLFDSPVREQHLRAVAAIFGKVLPSSFERSDEVLATVQVA